MAFLADRGVNLDQVSFESCYHEIEIVPRTLPRKSGAMRIIYVDTACADPECFFRGGQNLTLV